MNYSFLQNPLKSLFTLVAIMLPLSFAQGQSSVSCVCSDSLEGNILNCFGSPMPSPNQSGPPFTDSKFKLYQVLISSGSSFGIYCYYHNKDRPDLQDQILSWQFDNGALPSKECSLGEKPIIKHHPGLCFTPGSGEVCKFVCK